MPQEALQFINSISSVSREILYFADKDLQRPEFFRQILKVILNLSRCDAAEIYLLESDRFWRSTISDHNASEGAYETPTPSDSVLELESEIYASDEKAFIAVCCSILSGRLTCSDPDLTLEDCLWTVTSDKAITLDEVSEYSKRSYRFFPSGPYQSIAMVPFDLERNNRGMLVLKHSREQFFTREKIEMLKVVGQLLGMPVVLLRTQLALRERIKELTCLYGISKLVGPVERPLDQILEATVELIPPAWLYPEITSARIELDEKSFFSSDYRGSSDRLRADILVEGRKRGFVEVVYAARKPELDEGPFLQEERNLIDAIAKDLAHIIEQHQAELKSEELQQQLLHADRLATIGQLSAGVAHELNEPLGGILGFAQLARKNPDIPSQTRQDLDKIVNASLHAREIVKKLMLFARQADQDKKWVDLNLLVADGLYFLESRCAKSDIELVKELDTELPEITADPGQVYQVLINLAVNAIQAMPQGGRLTIRTYQQEGGISLEVEDTGTGISEEMQMKVFTPFFTTKDVGEGTGLGLSVVDGIVTSHGGSITMESTMGIGTRFTVNLPLKQPMRDSR